MPLDGVSSFDQSPTPGQHGTLRALGVADASVRHAPLGPDVFAYVEDEHATLRLQIAPNGGVIGQTVLTR
jgi:hypothetical protein